MFFQGLRLEVKPSAANRSMSHNGSGLSPGLASLSRQRGRHGWRRRRGCPVFPRHRWNLMKTSVALLGALLVVGLDPQAVTIAGSPTEPGRLPEQSVEGEMLRQIAVFGNDLRRSAFLLGMMVSDPLPRQRLRGKPAPIHELPPDQAQPRKPLTSTGADTPLRGDRTGAGHGADRQRLRRRSRQRGCRCKPAFHSERSAREARVIHGEGGSSALDGAGGGWCESGG